MASTLLKWNDLDRFDQRDEGLIARTADWVEAVLVPYHRAQVVGAERVVPGPALYVGNHSGGMWTADTFLFCVAVYRRWGISAVPYGLGHEKILMFPGVNQFIVPLGAVRASHENAERLFAEGHKVLVYPGGDIDSYRPFRHRRRVVFGGRRGFARLAIRCGVPIIPVVSAGSQSTFVVLDDLRWLAALVGAPRWLRTEVWPAILSFPWGLTIGPPPPYIGMPVKIVVEILDPIRFERSGDEAAADEAYVETCAAEVHSLMEATLERLSQPDR